MISLSHLNKLTAFVICLVILTFNSAFGEDEPADIWGKQEDQKTQSNEKDNQKDFTIENTILSDDVTKVVIKIDENQIEERDSSIIGIFDPEENNFNY